MAILQFRDLVKFIIDIPAAHEAVFIALSQRIVDDANSNSPGLSAIPPRFAARSLADEGRDKKRKSITIICQGNDPLCFAALYTRTKPRNPRRRAAMGGGVGLASAAEARARAM